jgi:hypothetical protein
MPEAVLKFQLPEESSEFKSAVNGSKYLAALEELDKLLREREKYGNLSGKALEQVENIRREFYETIQGYGIELYE